MRRYYLASLAALLVAGCGDPRTSYEREAEAAVVASATAQPTPTGPTEAELAEIARGRRIEAIRHADSALNWINIGVTTGKFSESLGSSVHKTFDECIKSSWMEDNECVPIPALPDSYWNAGEQVAP